MAISKKATGRAMSIPGGLAWGSVFGLTWTVVGACLAAKLISSETIPQETMGYWAMGILLTASFGSAMVACSRIKRLRVQVSMLSGLIYFMLLAAMTSLFFGGQFSEAGITALLVLLGSAAAVLPELLGRGGNPKRRYKI